MTPRNRVLVVIVAVLVGVALWWWLRAGRDSAAPSPSGPQAVTATGAPRSTTEATAPAGTAPGRPPVVRVPGTRVMSATERRALATAITTARSRRAVAAPPAEAPTTGGDETVNLTDKTGDNSPWEKRTVGLLNDLLGECYSLARATDPDLAGSLTVQFSIAGEPKVGGLVDDLAFDETGSTITSTDMRDCVRESISALELEPPPSGLAVRRQISMKLQP